MADYTYHKLATSHTVWFLSSVIIIDLQYIHIDLFNTQPNGQTRLLWPTLHLLTHTTRITNKDAIITHTSRSGASKPLRRLSDFVRLRVFVLFV